MNDRTLTSDEMTPAAQFNAKRVAASLAFHRERLEWLSKDKPHWDDGTPVEKSDARILTNLSVEAIRLLEQGVFVAGGDA
jgi:hypothetical protein